MYSSTDLKSVLAIVALDPRAAMVTIGGGKRAPPGDGTDVASVRSNRGVERPWTSRNEPGEVRRPRPFANTAGARSELASGFSDRAFTCDTRSPAQRVKFNDPQARSHAGCVLSLDSPRKGISAKRHVVRLGCASVD